MKRILSLVLLTLALSGCHGYQVHPGAINQFDSQVYDSLIAAKTMIDTARTQFASGVLPVRLKPAVNEIIRVYDIAYPAYNVWRDAVQAGKPGDQALLALNKDIADLSKAIAAFKGGQ